MNTISSDMQPDMQHDMPVIQNNRLKIEDISKTIIIEMRRVLSYLIVIFIMFIGFWIISKQTLVRQEEIIRKQEETLKNQKIIISNQTIAISRQKLLIKMQDETIPQADLQIEKNPNFP